MKIKHLEILKLRTIAYILVLQAILRISYCLVILATNEKILHIFFPLPIIFLHRAYNATDIKEFFSQLNPLKKIEQAGFHISGRPLIIDSIEVDRSSFWKTAKTEPLLTKTDIE
jgi:hypothetical protein